MRLLLDAHSLIWAVDDPSKLGPKVVAIIENPANELLVSAGTIWELAIKVGLGKLKLSLPFGQWMNQAITDLGASILPISIAHAEAQAQLPGTGDPFDRLLAAQSKVENLTVVSKGFRARSVWCSALLVAIQCCLTAPPPRSQIAESAHRRRRHAECRGAPSERGSCSR